MSAAISFEGVSKHYRGAHTYQSLRDDVVGAARRVVGLRREKRPTLRALDDVSFDVPEGQALALIGLNGAGKTTCLKLMSRISYPSAGVVRVRGRVGALIEVGTGMHPELTGRENVQLYGRILGLTGRDIRRRFDEIVEFSGVGAAIDQPLKQYSSGMQLRIGFSVAAHLEPDVLLVDEAIAVGDAGFQFKCVERMSELVREGRTLVFVSHDMSAVETLCQRAVLLQDGKAVEDGTARDVVRSYLSSVQAQQMAADSSGYAEGGDLDLLRVTLHDASGREVNEIPADAPMTVRMHYRAKRPIVRPNFSIGLSDGMHGIFALASMLVDGQSPEVLTGDGHVDCTFVSLPLQPRAYEIWGEVIGHKGYGEIVDWQRLRLFQVSGEIRSAGKSAITHSMADAPVKIPYRWSVDGSGE